MISIFSKRKSGLVNAIALALLAAGGQAAADNGPIAKQLSGSPSDFASMKAADPTDATIHSKSALIAVELSQQKDGRLGWQGRLPIENGDVRFLLFSGQMADAWQADLVSPSGGMEKSAADLARSVKRTQFGMQQATFPADLYSLEGVESGTWNLKISAAAGASKRGFLLMEGSDSTELASHQTHSRQLVGERIGLAARLTATGNDEKVLMGDSAGRIDSAELRVTYPDGRIAVDAMFDDGAHDDGVAGDGVFGGDFFAASAGDYLAQVVVTGVDRNGQDFIRTAEHPIPVVEASIALAGDVAVGVASAEAGTRLQIQLPVISDKANQHYRAYAEVWGTDKSGNRTAVAWVGGMVTPDNGALKLGFDERWIAMAGASAPFELRNLRIEDPNNFVTLASTKRIAMSLPTQRVKAGATGFKVDESMQMGPRPSGAQHKGVGKRLLLVHGYCSGGVWPAGQFTTASTFLDANQNRSHDQFARLIQTFGNTWNSYGIVAHSQGGAAALHLYNYYWSGLDYATGSRLIQSVGTPYKGTNLSGILASVGNVFGVGCGSNNNLTYSGASGWLAGIPTSSRAKVNYYTTAFRTTNWWTNDYCNFATDLVLSDPEDGTTEQTNGQLSGGVNRGHTTGQCHTAGMRDPAQFLDSGRNSVMNTNAAR
ncbi:MAG: choice-of-anchor X domain-containing protein [Pseudomarimonas sp.]